MPSSTRPGANRCAGIGCSGDRRCRAVPILESGRLRRVVPDADVDIASGTGRHGPPDPGKGREADIHGAQTARDRATGSTGGLVNGVAGGHVTSSAVHLGGDGARPIGPQHMELLASGQHIFDRVGSGLDRQTDVPLAEPARVSQAARRLDEPVATATSAAATTGRACRDRLSVDGRGGRHHRPGVCR